MPKKDCIESTKSFDDYVDDYWIKQSGGNLDHLALEIMKAIAQGNQDYIQARMSEYKVKKNNVLELSQKILHKRGLK